VDRRTRSWAVRFGLAGLALFAVSVVLLMQAGRPADPAEGLT
jgi:hypothetical protein